MRKNKFHITTLLSLLVFAGCGDEDVDVTPPSMEVVSFIPSPSEDNICGTQEPNVFNLTGGDQLILT